MVLGDPVGARAPRGRESSQRLRESRQKGSAIAGAMHLIPWVLLGTHWRASFLLALNAVI
jgi:hypothetical protein